MSPSYARGRSGVRPARAFGALVAAEIAEDRLFVVACLLYVAAGTALNIAYGQRSGIGFAYYFYMFGGVYAATAVLLTGFKAAGGLLRRPLLRRIALRHFPNALRAAEALSPDRIVAVLACTLVPMILLLPAMMSTYTSLKHLIPVFQPFAFDSLFAELDHWLHLGRHPWVWLQPLLGHPPVTMAIQMGYVFWGPVTVGTAFAICFMESPRRQRLFLAYLFCWALIGNVGAILLSSAGPVYYGRVTGLADPYLPLLAYLDGVPWLQGYSARDYHEYLWQVHTTESLGTFTGISAMPSMHLSMATFLVLMVWRYGVLARTLSLGYLGLILIGSVHLAWHYAIDGYVAIVLTVVIWWLVSRLMAETPQGAG